MNYWSWLKPRPPSYVGRPPIPKRAYGLQVGTRVRFTADYLERMDQDDARDLGELRGMVVDIDDLGCGIAIAKVLWNNETENECNIKILRRG